MDTVAVLLLDDACIAGIALFYLVVARQDCSLETGRRFVAAGLLVAGAIALYDDVPCGDLQNPGFLMVIYSWSFICWGP